MVVGCVKVIDSGVAEIVPFTENVEVIVVGCESVIEAADAPKIPVTVRFDVIVVA